MARISTLALRQRVSTHWQTTAGKTKGLVIVPLVLLAAIPFADSAIQHEFPALRASAISPATATPAAIDPDLALLDPTTVPSAASSKPDRDIEAVAAVVSKRYRVSLEATRPLVGAAFQEGARIGIDPLLIVAVIAVESRFNPIAQSDGGAMGLMQIIPRYHADKLASADKHSVLDPPKNIELGARVLKEYIKRGGTEIAGLQLYNGNIDDESNAYAGRVLGEKQRLKEAIRRAREAARA